MFFLLKRLFYPSSRFFCVSLHRIKKLASYAQDKPDTLFCIVHEPSTRYFYVVIIMSFRKTISWFLFPLTVWYAVGVCFRNLLFALGIKSQTAPPVTTIGVGNLCTGGSGKTPHVEYLLRLLSGSYETALLSRGYRRKTSGFVLDDGCHSPSRLGDEPSMLALKFPNVTVAVCEKRVEGVHQLLKRDPAPQLIVLDDVFQHRYLKPTVNILLTEYGNPYFKDHILPFGNLREFRSARRRADIVIDTKSTSSLNPIYRHNYHSTLSTKLWSLPASPIPNLCSNMSPAAVQLSTSATPTIIVLRSTTSSAYANRSNSSKAIANLSSPPRKTPYASANWPTPTSWQDFPSTSSPSKFAYNPPSNSISTKPSKAS